MSTWTVIREHNEWEGETWTHVFPTPPDPNLAAALDLIGDLPGFEVKHTDSPPAPREGSTCYLPEIAAYTAIDPALFALLMGSTQEEIEELLYKGKLRDCGIGEIVAGSEGGDSQSFLGKSAPPQRETFMGLDLSLLEVDDEIAFVSQDAGGNLVDARVLIGPLGLVSSSPPVSTWLDDDGRLTRGSIRGFVEDVARDDPSYLRWILSETDCCDEDAEIIRVHLERAS